MKLQNQISLLAALVFSGASCATVKGEIAYRGNYYWGHEVETFHPCDSEQAFWVTGSDVVLQPLRDEARKSSIADSKPYQPIYVEIFAVPEGKSGDGFAADYDGVYRVTFVKKFSTGIPSNCRED